MSTDRPAVNIAIMEPPGYAHSGAFLDIGELLLHSFESLGHRCKLQTNRLDKEGVNVVLGYHLLADPAPLHEHRCVIYQLEQFPDRPRAVTNMAPLLTAADEVWDYATENVTILRDYGIDNVHLLPIGFHEKSRTIRRANQDIDVLFFGSTNTRRAAILEELARDCAVVPLYGVYGVERDDHIARSRIVLNIHYYAAQVMEQTRIAPLLNNRCFVISEDSPHNPYAGGLVTAPYDELVESCRSFLALPDERYRMAKSGYEMFRRRPMVADLARVLAESSIACP